MSAEDYSREAAIAITGMAGRFPKAPDLARFWQNLTRGVNCVTFFSAAELRAAGVPSDLIENPRYVPARAVLQDADAFDAAFFGITAREAAAMDPQQRLLLECAWEALEDAGQAPGALPAAVGVFAGASSNWYILNVWSDPAAVAALGEATVSLGNDRDHLATRIAYKLDLRGPCVNVQSACSTSLLAVHLACQSLLAGECDLALAGGVSVRVDQQTGYLAYAGGTGSADGRTRAFDAGADGTVGGSGVGLVVLKRLADALADGDFLHAVIRGSAANNDGASKVGYAAPSVDGQAEVVERALALSGLPVASIGYVEAHGTGTALGDPIEVRALTQAYRRSTDAVGFCALGSVKTNIGHLDSAAGIAGLIKAVLMVREGQLVPSLHYERPNPHIDFAASPFYVNTELRGWRSAAAPRRAGVSSFGLGGTNVHLLLEEAPRPPARRPLSPPHLLTLSAKTPSALGRGARRLAAHLGERPDGDLGDLAFTLQTGRRELPCRLTVVAASAEEAAGELAAAAPLTATAATGAMAATATAAPPRAGERPSLCFLFPGLGCQRPGMAAELYDAEPPFRAALDDCCSILQPLLGLDLRRLLLARQEVPPERIYEGWLGQPAVFAVEWALARTFMAWGLTPQAMLGHSLGEYTAACLAGVLSLPDALLLVAERARLMDQTPAGSMLSIQAGEAAVRPLLPRQTWVAILNTADHCVVAGSDADAMAELEGRLAERGIGARRVKVARAYHSPAMDAILAPFATVVARVRLQPPRIPYVSNVSGTWITTHEACDPGYWVRHLRETVRFADGLARLLELPDPLLLEAGPAQVVSPFARHAAAAAGRASAIVVAALPAAGEELPRRAHLLQAVGRLWEAGAGVRWQALHAGTEPRRVPAPTYAWDHCRYWAAQADTPAAGPHARPAPAAAGGGADGTESGDGGTAVQSDVAALWRAMLGVRAVRPSDSFLALGGDSLLALQLTARLNQTYGLDLSLHAVLEARTLSGLAAVVDAHLGPRAAGAGGAASGRDGLVVEIEPGDRHAPLFLPHAVGGSVFRYAPLAQGLRDGHAIFGLQPAGFDGRSALLTTVEAMAERFVRAIRSVQPRGPYLLAGASFGGTLAWEIAAQLAAANAQVALLALIDTPGADLPLAPVTSSADVLIELFGQQIALDRATLAALATDEQIEHVTRLLALAGKPLAETDLAGMRLRIDIWRSNYTAMLRYEPRPWPGRAIYFRAREQPAGSFPERYWIERAAGGLETQIVAGGHQTMMSPPHVADLAARLRDAVRAARLLHGVVAAPAADELAWEGARR